MNEEFEKYLRLGYLEPVTFPDGEKMIIDDVQYYWPTEKGASLSIGRFHAISDIAKTHEIFKTSLQNVQIRQRLTHELCNKAILSLTSDPEQSLECLEEIKRVNKAEIQRMDFGSDITQVFEIAAIWIIAEDESPGRVVAQKHRKKIESWSRFPELYGFFLNLPLNALYPLRLLFEQDTLTSSMDLAAQELSSWMQTLTRSEILGLGDETMQSISSRAEVLKNVISSTYALSKDTLKN